MRGLDFSSWQTMLFTLVGLAVITLIGIGIRLLVMQTVQQRRERDNRQINERLRTLIAAYKILGSSFTGDLGVDPTHLRDIKHKSEQHQTSDEIDDIEEELAVDKGERSRRIRDAVEGALSDIILLGTDEQVKLAAQAATELAEGRQIHTAQLVISLRDFIRKTLGLDPIPCDLHIPQQGPARPTGAKNKSEVGDKEKGSGRSGTAGGGGGIGMVGAGMGMGVGVGANSDNISNIR
ncbi:MAG: hypothetical protein LBG67_00030 [Campylobacteraceae bacterium]|jgi:hypothetical protein|nr:hypothetical protein [Campylobacteraceae bacterium]